MKEMERINRLQHALAHGVKKTHSMTKVYPLIDETDGTNRSPPTRTRSPSH